MTAGVRIPLLGGESWFAAALRDIPLLGEAGVGHQKNIRK